MSDQNQTQTPKPPQDENHAVEIYAVENHVIGTERLAVMPHDVALELPGHRLAITRNASVLQARYLRRKKRHEVSLRISSGERLIEDGIGTDRNTPRTVHVFAPLAADMSAAAIVLGSGPIKRIPTASDL